MFDKNNVDYKLYLCTDRDIMTAGSVESLVEQAVKGGCSVIQLREKNSTSKEFYQLAVKVKSITHKYNVPLIINDRVDIALLAHADGVHLGQKDLPCSEVRKLAGDNFIIGVSTALPEEAVKAQADGADYLGVGAVCRTSTKTDTRPVSIDTIKKIRSAVSIPFVIIGGVNENTIGQFNGLGVNGAAVCSAVAGKPDIVSAAKKMRELALKL